MRVKLGTWYCIMTVVEQEILSPESVSLDSLCICLEFQSAGDPRLKRVSHCQKSRKAEYVAMLETVKEIRFILYLLRSMSIVVKLPIIVRCDNVGAIFMAENSSSGVRTRHVDTKYHFVWEHIVDDFIKIVFVKSCENVADLFPKNVSKDAYTKHVSNFLGKMEDSNG
jgi:hypothetical protein